MHFTQQKKAMRDKFHTTSCSSHLEPKVMLNVQLESPLLHTMQLIGLRLVHYTTESVIASSRAHTLKHLKSAKTINNVTYLWLLLVIEDM